MRANILRRMLFLAATSFSLTALQVSAGTIATYNFQGNTTATQGGIPALSVILDGVSATSAFTTDTVFGVSRQVLQLNGVGSTNAGLQFNNSGGQLPSATYSAEMIFEFTQNPGGFRKIVDSQNRGSDVGFYVSPGSQMDVFNASPTGTTLWTNNVYHDVVLVVTGGNASVYLDDHLEMTAAAGTILNIDASNLLDFFLDDNATGRNEFSSSQVARIQLFDTALVQTDVDTLWNGGNPVTGGVSSIPEPGTWMTLGGGLIALAGLKFRKLRA